jgi:patatin-related protein
MRAIIASIRPEVERQVEALFGFTLFLDRPNAARLGAWRRRAQTAAADKAGYGYAAYGHLKIHGVVELLATLLHHAGNEPGPERLQRLRERVAEVIHARGVDRIGAIFTGGASRETIDFLRTFDLGFRIRRLRLLARRLSTIEVEEDSAALVPMREAIYEALSAYLEVKRTGTYAHLRRQIRNARGDDGALLDALATAMDLNRLDAETDARLADGFAALSKEHRRPLLLGYLGFPYYDLATLPLLQGEGLDEFDPIKVDRISPDDATTIRSGGAAATLKGIQFMSFGAFFSRSYRENDYLWGRLHGAERLIDIVLSTLPANSRLKPGRVAAIKTAAFTAILDEEEPRLTAIPGLIAALRREIG